MQRNTLRALVFFTIIAAGVLFSTGCDTANTPGGKTGTPQNGLEELLSGLTPDMFPKPPAGITYTGYIITWTDANGKVRTKHVHTSQDITLDGGLKQGTKPVITPLISGTAVTPNSENKILQNQFPQQPNGIIYKSYIIRWRDASGNHQQKKVDTPQDVTLEGGLYPGSTPTITPVIQETSVTPSDPAASWQEAVQAGTRGLKATQWEAAVAAFKKAYQLEANNTTKAYYALVTLAAISTKPETVQFMRNRMGFAAYPEKLNALVNLDWFEYNDVQEYLHYRSQHFTQSPQGEYVRVNGRIVSRSVDAAGKLQTELWSCYAQNTFDASKFDLAPGESAPQWLPAHTKEQYTYIEQLPKKDRTRNKIWDWVHDKKLIIDSPAANGTFIVEAALLPQAEAKYRYTASSGTTNYGYMKYTRAVRGMFPETKKVNWTDAPYLYLYDYIYLPAYIVEHSAHANTDTLLDELYSLIFGKEYAEAEQLLTNLEAGKDIIIDAKLLKLLNLTPLFGEDEIALQKDQLCSIIGGFKILKGMFELLQSYSLNTDLSILKFNWANISFQEGLAANINGYDKKLDPFNNGFLTGRNPQKITDSKQSIISGCDLLLAFYESVSTDANMPQAAKDAVQQYEFMKAVVTEVRNAVKEGRKANFLIGNKNMLADRFRTFEIDMGKVFTYEYFKLSKAFEMNGTKPKIFPPQNGKPAYIQTTLKEFMDDFMQVEIKQQTGETFNITEIVTGLQIPLEGPLGSKIKQFYQ